MRWCSGVLSAAKREAISAKLLKAAPDLVDGRALRQVWLSNFASAHITRSLTLAARELDVLRRNPTALKLISRQALIRGFARRQTRSAILAACQAILLHQRRNIPILVLAEAVERGADPPSQDGVAIATYLEPLPVPEDIWNALAEVADSGNLRDIAGGSLRVEEFATTKDRTVQVRRLLKNLSRAPNDRESLTERLFYLFECRNIDVATRMELLRSCVDDVLRGCASLPQSVSANRIDSMRDGLTAAMTVLAMLSEDLPSDPDQLACTLRKMYPQVLQKCPPESDTVGRCFQLGFDLLLHCLPDSDSVASQILSRNLLSFTQRYTYVDKTNSSIVATLSGQTSLMLVPTLIDMWKGFDHNKTLATMDKVSGANLSYLSAMVVLPYVLSLLQSSLKLINASKVFSSESLSVDLLPEEQIDPSQSVAITIKVSLEWILVLCAELPQFPVLLASSIHQLTTHNPQRSRGTVHAIAYASASLPQLQQEVFVALQSSPHCKDILTFWSEASANEHITDAYCA